MATRTYGDGCAIAQGLDLVGERWALLLVRELLLGPKRYTDLRRGLPNASPNVLAERLRGLEGAGIVRKRTLPPPAGARVYELTEWGRGLEDIVIGLGRWAASAPTAPSDAPVASPDSVVLALRSRFDPTTAAGVRASYGLHLGDERFRVDVADERLTAVRGETQDAETIIETDPDTISAVLWGGRSLADAQRAGALTYTGDKAAVQHFVRLFPIPAAAARGSRTA